MSAKQKDVGSSPAHDQKNVLCRFFFRLVRPFSANFLNVSKGSPFILSYFAKEWMFKNSQRPPCIHFSALCDLPETKKNRKKIRKKIQKNRIFFNFFFTRVL